ncbi:MAG: FKBP-type peptidyl-prolyl cis-trans isomerase [Candidatus Zixiibacteriota bacterium]
MTVGLKQFAIVVIVSGLMTTGATFGGDEKPVKSDSTITILRAKPTTITEKGRPTLRLMGDTIVTASGLKYIQVKPGTGGKPRPGQTVLVHYVASLPDGKKLESTREREVPFEFVIGKGQVIKGLDEGVASMNIGELRKLIVPSQLAEGEKLIPAGIPPKTSVIFEIELLGVK